MAKTLVEMAAELVQAQCVATSMTAEEMAQSLQATYNVLHGLQQDESRGAAADGGQVSATLVEDPKRSIQKHKIICLECGEEFKSLSPKHLRSHELDGRSYRRKWGIPLGQALCAKELSDRRRKSGKARGISDSLRQVIAARKGIGKAKTTAKGTAKTTAKGTAKTTTKGTARKTRTAANAKA